MAVHTAVLSSYMCKGLGGQGGDVEIFISGENGALLDLDCGEL